MLLRDVEQLRERVRRDRHSASVPLLLFGVLTAASAPVVDPRYSGPAWWAPGLEYWAVAAPLGLLLMAWWYRRQRHRTGVGGPDGWPVAALAAGALALAFAAFPHVLSLALWAVAAALVVAAAVRRSWRLAAGGVAAVVLAPVVQVALLVVPGGTPTALVGLGLLTLGVWQRDRFLAGTAAAFTVLALLDRVGMLGNALGRLGVPGQSVLQVLLGLLLIVAGGIAWRRETEAA